jgi:hypothetical protein
MKMGKEDRKFWVQSVMRLAYDLDDGSITEEEMEREIGAILEDVWTEAVGTR